jgi:hypothetical protein
MKRLADLMALLQVVDNNGPVSVGGGGAVQPLLPAISNKRSVTAHSRPPGDGRPAGRARLAK